MEKNHKSNITKVFTLFFLLYFIEAFDIEEEQMIDIMAIIIMIVKLWILNYYNKCLLFIFYLILIQLLNR